MKRSALSVQLCWKSESGITDSACSWKRHATKDTRKCRPETYKADTYVMITIYTLCKQVTYEDTIQQEL
jgi:hypothetical protein